MKTIRHTLVRLAVATAVIAGQSAAAHAKPAMNSRQMMSLSARDADEKARRDLLSILQPASKFSKGMFRAVRGNHFDTVPHGTGMKGLCARDTMILWYKPTAARAEPMNEPERPVGISVSHLYHAAGKAVLENDRVAEVANVWSRDCKGLQSDKTINWFPAESDAQAAKAVNVLLTATEAVRSGRLKAKSCDYAGRGKTCEEDILAEGSVGNILDIDANCTPSLGEVCLSLDLDRGLRLIVEFSRDEDAMVPKEILSISAVSYVVVT